MNMKYMPGPTISRKTGKNNSDILWGESGLDVFRMEKLAIHMRGLRDELYPLFNEKKKSLPKNSELQTGGVFGCWVKCPNEFADEVEAIVLRRHDEFRSSKYGKMKPEEPVAWRWLYDGKPEVEKFFPMPGPDADVIALAANSEFPRTVQYLYAAPQPAPEPLTDDEIADIYADNQINPMRFARSIERAHGITGDEE